MRAQNALSTFVQTYYKSMILVWQSGRFLTTLFGIITACQGVVPACQVWIGKLIVDGVVEAINQPQNAGIDRLILLVVIELAIVSFGHLLHHAQRFVEQALQDRLIRHIQVLILRKTISLDLAFFETSKFYDRLEKGRQESIIRPYQLLVQSFDIIRNLLMLVGMLVLLLAFNWLIVVVLFAVSIPTFFVELKHSFLNYIFIDGRTPEGRKQSYYSTLLSSNQYIKEIKLFQLGDYFLRKWTDIFWKIYREKISLNMRRQIAGFSFKLLSAVGFYASYVYIVYQTVQTRITLGEMTMYIQAFSRSQNYLENLLRSIAFLYEGSLFVSHLFELLALEPTLITPPSAKTAPTTLSKVEFINVSFKYPDSEKYILESFNLTIEAGETIAIVGKNGAGKTTMIKLLARFYDPNEGTVLFNGIDIRTFDLDSIRQRISILFQDYVKYFSTVQENIGYGQIEDLENIEDIVAAAHKSGANEVADKLPSGYETVLGKLFDEGEEISIGEWQRIALARALMRDVPILVLDEPTASLDAEAEYEVFKKFKDLTRGKITLLTSHRFSTVRMADRILVLEQGKIIEQGTHQELIANAGIYANLFHKQAEAYK